jgi:adenine-specific DNA-methyltransferase
MDLNAEDGGNRKYILVQLPERIDEKQEAYKAGYRKISEITRDRLLKAGEKITS